MSKVPKLRFSEFKGEWEEKELGEVVEILNNKRKPITNSHRVKGNIPYYGASGIIDYVESYIFNDRILLIGEDGAKWGAYENTAFIVEGKCWVNNHAHVVKAISINDMFLKNYLNKVDLMPFITGSAPPKLTLGKLKSIRFLAPSIEEQQKIADCLSSLDELIEARREKIASLKEYKKGLLQQLFPEEVSKSTPPPPLIFNKLPKIRFAGFEVEWEEVTIESIFKITRGNVLPMTLLKQEYSEEYPYPVYSSQTKNNGLAGYYNEFLYENAITWTTDGANAGEVNYRKEKFYCTNVCGVLISEKGYANKCIAELINSVSKNYVSYVGNPKLMNGVMGSIKIQIPTEQKEQQKIADCLLSLDEKIAAETEQVTQLQQHKKGLLQQLLV